MKSIKAKFTLTLSIVLFGVIMFLATVIYFVNVNTQGPITPQVISVVADDNPRLAGLLARINENQGLSEVFELIRKEETQKYTDTLIILIPPTIILSALIAYAVSLYLLGPIEDLAIALKRIGSHNISERLPNIKSSTEIEDLIKTFNQLLDDLEKAFNIQDQFIQDAAHEIRTPIAAMKTNIEVYKESKDKTLEDQNRLIITIEKINNKLIKLNESMLFLNRKYDNTNDIVEINIQEIIEETIETLIYLAKQKNISININSDKNINKIKANPTRFSTAIKNLIENSIKYSANNTEINISIKHNKSNTIIEISDQGIGMTSEEQERIFDRFYRSENTKQEGEGLGLSIVKKIIDAYKWTIKVESEKDKGSKFIITIPADK